MSRILITDDDPHVLRILSELLRDYEHEVIEASDGRTALRYFMGGQFATQPDLRCFGYLGGPGGIRGTG
jgi:CheY-like chemotaxis protein